MRRFASVGIVLLAWGCVEENADAMVDGGVGACVPGRALECACPGGNMGTQACLDDLTFGPCVCGEAGECEPGQVEQEACEGGTRARRCDAGGVWADWSRCEGGCEAGAEQTRECGRNDRGEQARACVDGVWEAWSDCDDPDGCADGDEEREACGEGGMRTRTCEQGGWSSWTLCEVDNPECAEEGAVEEGECGLNGRGQKSRRCADGVWGDWSECDDPDECRDGATTEEPCGDDGVRSRTCQRGGWGNWTACMEDRPRGNCPVASVRERLLEAEPLETITLQPGPASIGGPNAPVAWRWVVVDRPAGSTASVVEPGGGRDDVSTPEAEFFLDLAGHYEFELQVEGRNGKIAPSDACPQDPARVQVDVVSTEAIHIQLVWDTPGDDDQTDNDGTDLDLHLLHPRGQWGREPWDCFWRNPTPDWGREGPRGDPSLDIDDTNGAGPENINLNEPEALESPYVVGVEFYGMGGFPGLGLDALDTTATVRVFLEGELALETERLLTERGQFWHAAAITWEGDGGEAEALNRPLGRIDD